MAFSIFQIFEGILRIGNLYMQLCEMGQIDFLTWKRKFECRKEMLLNDIEKCCKTMEGKLEQWKECISRERKRCYFLNHFTMKQILKLRKELAEVCAGQVPIDELTFQTYTLLETVSKGIDPLSLAAVLQRIIPKNELFFREESLDVGKKYFKNGVDDEKNSKDDVTKETSVFPKKIKKRKNSLENFKSAKETLEKLGKNDEDVVAALQICGRYATDKELVTCVLNWENDEEEVDRLFEEAKQNPSLSDLLTDFIDTDYRLEDDEKTSSLAR